MRPKVCCEHKYKDPDTIPKSLSEISLMQLLHCCRLINLVIRGCKKEKTNQTIAPKAKEELVLNVFV